MTKNTRRFSIFFGLLALLLTAAGVIYAQARQDGTMGGMMSMMKDCPMMKSAQQGPAAVLQHKEKLGLTAEQVQRLEALRKDAHRGHMQVMGQMQALHQEIAEATQGERFDETAARVAFDRMGAMHTERGVAMLRAQHQTKQTLTPEQRESLSKLGGGMMGMHGMMQDCPMMKGMMKGMMNRDESGSMQHHDHQG